MTYRDSLRLAMNMLAEDRRTLFLGQAVGFPGTYMTATLDGVPLRQLVELPVAEEMQLGMCTGLALAGYIPVSIYPRWNFLLLAANQLVGHLDKLPLISGYRPKVIVRVGVGAEGPLHPQEQHVGDFTHAFRLMCRTLTFIRLLTAAEVVPAYRTALEREGSTVLVEYGELYYQ